MKRLLFSSVLILSITALSAQVIKYPTVGNKVNAEGIELSSVEFSKPYTIFNITYNGRFCPQNEILLQSGNKYFPMLKLEGESCNEDSTGKAKLYFTELSIPLTHLSLFEDCENCFQIDGIELFSIDSYLKNPPLNNDIIPPDAGDYLLTYLKSTFSDYDPTSIEGFWVLRTEATEKFLFVSYLYGDINFQAKEDNYEGVYIIKNGKKQYDVFGWNGKKLPITLISTADKQVFLLLIDDRMTNGSVNNNFTRIQCENVEFYLSIGGNAAGKKINFEFIKMYPSIDDVFDLKKPVKSSTGSGFFVTRDGYIATSNHVVSDASEITVERIEKDGKKHTYNGKIVLQDTKNDLALIKVDLPQPLPKLPYKIKDNYSEIGEKVVVFGFPSIHIMGEEMKVTTGIISSSSGAQGDITRYQISAAVQKGNSGSPLFDEKGNVIGVVDSKLSYQIADNVSYSIKSSYLNNLLRLIPNYIPTEPDAKDIKENLVDQVKKYSPYVVIIKVAY